MEFGSQLFDHGSEYRFIKIQSGIGRFRVTQCPDCEKRIFDIWSAHIFAAIRLKCPHCRKIVRISVLTS